MRRREFIALAGGVAAWPITGRAQQHSMNVIGFLSGDSAHLDGTRLSGLRRGLKEGGYIEGHNIAIEYRGAERKSERLAALAADLVGHPVSAIVAAGPTVALAAKALTATVPIVFTISGDPVALGLVASFNRPGGNVTGVSTLASVTVSKLLQLLQEILPGVAPFGFLANAASPQGELEIKQMQAAAQTLGRELLVATAATESQIEEAFAALTERRVSAIAVGNDALFNSRPAQIVTLAAQRALPVVYPLRDFPEAGGLMSYGSSLADAYRITGNQVRRILNGEKPAELPVIQATRVELVVNLKTAKALGITIPTLLLARADEVIE